MNKAPAAECTPWPERFIESALGSGRAIVFLIDCSNAMQGEALRVAKSHCRELIGRLADQREFALLAYGSGAFVFDEQLHTAGRRTKSLANDFLDLVDVMGENALNHALRRALLYARGQALDIVLLAQRRGQAKDQTAKWATEQSVRIHCIEYSTDGNGTLNSLAEQTRGAHLLLAKPSSTDPLARASLPRKYACYDTALTLLGRPPVPCSPDDLLRTLRNPLHADGGDTDGTLSATRLEERFPASIRAALVKFKQLGSSEAFLVVSLERALHDILHLGGESWSRDYRLAPIPSPDRLMPLELRLAVMSACSAWCMQEMVFNETYFPEDIPAFLRR